MIAPHIFFLSMLFSAIWGWHLVDTVRDYRETRVRKDRRRRGELGDAFRSMITAICFESICIAYVLRTALVLAGLGDVSAGQVVFFSILGVNIPGAIFVVASRRFD